MPERTRFSRISVCRRCGFRKSEHNSIYCEKHGRRSWPVASYRMMDVEEYDSTTPEERSGRVMSDPDAAIPLHYYGVSGVTGSSQPVEYVADDIENPTNPLVTAQMLEDYTRMLRESMARNRDEQLRSLWTQTIDMASTPVPPHISDPAVDAHLRRWDGPTYWALDDNGTPYIVPVRDVQVQDGTVPIIEQAWAVEDDPSSLLSIAMTEEEQ